MGRVYAVEDGNLSTSIITARTSKYTDMDISFINKPTTASGPGGVNVRTDIEVISDAVAVKQSIQNILLTGKGEKPFMPMYGTDLQYLLFDLDTDFDEDLLHDEITNSINIFEPRANIQKIRTEIIPENHNVKVTIEFQVVSSSEFGIVEIDIARLR